MDVYVDPSWIHLKKYERQRVTTLRDQRMITFRQREGHRATVDRTAVDDGDQVLTSTAAHAGLTQQAAEAHAWTRKGRHDRDFFGYLAAPDFADTIQ